MVAAWAVLGATAAAQDLGLTPIATEPQSLEDLRNLSIEQLGQVQVTSVAKQAQALSDAPAAIYVITHDQIVRSGAKTIPEVLRLAPNLQVYRTSASQYVITARGFDGSQAFQNFSNKLLVLIDGRSVYTPMFSGVYWDMQDVVVEDIDRVEVISGPGATLWGANAVNGVINIITRDASQTQGGQVDVAGGNLDGAVSVRYGGRIGGDLAYRLYFKETVSGATDLASGAKAHDSWSRPQGGFRLDWTPSAADSVTLQGDAFSAAEAEDGGPNTDIQGRNLTARWDHDWGNGHASQFLAYYDYAERQTQSGGGDNGGFYVNAYDLEAQDSFPLGGRNHVVWGAGARFSQYAIVNAHNLQFQPSKGTLKLFDGFVQDTLTLTDTARVVAGLKVENDPYSGISLLPDVRLSWNLSPEVLLWAAASRAIRSPTPFDDDVVEKVGGQVFLTGNPQFQPEKLTAFQLGARAQGGRASLSVSAYYNIYDNLRSIEPAPVTFLPLYWGNGMRAETYGVEVWGDWQATPWWRLSPGIAAMHERFYFRPGATTMFGLTQAADDPAWQARLNSSMNLGRSVTFDVDLRYVDAAPNPRLPAYAEVNARIAWDLSRRLQLSLSGLNLLHARHIEAPGADYVPRSVLAELLWRF